MGKAEVVIPGRTTSAIITMTLQHVWVNGLHWIEGRVRLILTVRRLSRTSLSGGVIFVLCRAATNSNWTKVGLSLRRLKELLS
jgi:hypothetical protein